MNQTTSQKVIDLRMILQRIIMRKRLFIITLPIVFVVSCLLILCVPRTYTSRTTMAPELNTNSGAGTLGDIASSFGIDLSATPTQDAISPLLYPDLMNDNGFVTKLFNVQVRDVNNTFQTTYYQYLLQHTQQPWWTKVIIWVKALFSSSPTSQGTARKFDAYHLSKLDYAIAHAIRANILINTDKKTGTISITAEAQDPMVCKMLADATREQLQDYITKYRTSKARTDVEHYEQLVRKAKQDYERVRRTYGQYSDANMDVVLQSFKSKQEDLENDMQLKYNAYSALVAQLNAANAKLLEHTPAFTTLQGAEVPIKPSGPKRMIFVLTMVFGATVLLSLWSVKDILLAE